QFDERAVESVFLHRTRFARWRISPDEAVDVALERRRRDARESELPDQPLKLRLEFTPREPSARILVKDPPPRSGPLGRRSNSPVNEPEGAGILKVRVPAVVGEN